MFTDLGSLIKGYSGDRLQCLMGLETEMILWQNKPQFGTLFFVLFIRSLVLYSLFWYPLALLD